MRQIHTMRAQRNALARAQLAQWVADAHDKLVLLDAAIRALPDPDERPYERMRTARGAVNQRTDKRRRAAREAEKRDAAEEAAGTKKPARKPVDLLALLNSD